MKTQRTKKNIAGADDVVSLCFNPGLEQPPHPGASETDAKVRKKMNPAKNNDPVDDCQ